MAESLRMCCVCKQMLPKSQLIRIAKSAEGKVFIDLTTKADGRGAYVCNSKECKLKCKKHKALNRAFKSPVSEEIYDKLLEIKEI